VSLTPSYLVAHVALDFAGVAISHVISNVIAREISVVRLSLRFRAHYSPFVLLIRDRDVSDTRLLSSTGNSADPAKCGFVRTERTRDRIVSDVRR